MVSPKVPKFSGPITPLELTTWLEEYESVYDEKAGVSTGSENSPPPSDIPKIKTAGSALLEPSLAKWWKSERSEFLEEEATWDGFVDALKCRALGRSWRAHALKTFYTLQQIGASLDDYLAAMADARYILNHGEKVIDDEQYKSLLLFRASPTLSQKILEKQGFDLNKATPKDIRTLLRDVAGETSPLPTSRDEPEAKPEAVDSKSKQTATQGNSTVSAPNNANISGYQLLFSERLDTFGKLYSGDSASVDIFSYLANPEYNGRVVGFWTLENSLGMIERFEIVFHGWDYEYVPNQVCYKLDEDEYLNSLTLSWEKNHIIPPISSVRFGTSKGRSFTGGIEAEIRETLYPPKGYMIIGWYGSSAPDEKYSLLLRVGAIYAPIQVLQRG